MNGTWAPTRKVFQGCMFRPAEEIRCVSFVAHARLNAQASDTVGWKYELIWYTPRSREPCHGNGVPSGLRARTTPTAFVWPRDSAHPTATTVGGS
jgi:hypothetical protein